MKRPMVQPRYRRATIQKFLDYLEELDLQVYGPCYKDGKQFHASMDYDVEDIISRRNTIAAGKLTFGEWAGEDS